ncbi:hypothetical protein [Caldalkalibacillus mannanilyticus]|uniref:hypothetical protein n=1 Tax=Caldalkalibacillus mannanilyticus TaxID=1418 RepID=UPI000469B702|nr:hypothetical protein [Caldalkalibacillus mannanilyticus]
MKTKIIPYILLLTTMILAGCTSIESSSSNNQEQTQQNPSIQEENQIPPEKVALTYNKIAPIEPKENEGEIDQVLLEKELPLGKILIHTSKEEGMENDLFATYVNDAGNVYLLGVIGDPHSPTITS